jgi:hypothetical protein
MSVDGFNQTMIAGTGTNVMTDTWEQGTYQVGRGAGQTTINNGSVDNTGPDGITPVPANELDFGAGISDNQLWLAQSGNDLQIDVMGTQQGVTVADWFGNTPGNFSQLQTIGTADGNSLDNSQVSQLVQAMATFSAANTGFDPTASGNSQAPNDPGVQSAIAAAWQPSA